MPIWQTEQGYMAADLGAYTPALQANWLMLQMMVYGQYGVNKETNAYWNESVNGNWAWPEFLENADGSLNPAAVMMEVWSSELTNLNFTQAYNFGTEGNNIYVGSLYSNGTTNVAAFMASGDPSGNVQLQISGGNGTINVTNSFGDQETLQVGNGQVNLPVGETPSYVNLQAGQTLAVVQPNWGPDLAMESGVSITASNSNNGTGLLNDGVLQDWFWGQNSQSLPFEMNFDNTTPATIEVSLPSAQTIDKLVLFASVPWEVAGSLLDFDVQYQNSSGQWVELGNVNNNPATVGVYSPAMKTSVDSFYNMQSTFQVDFAPVVATNIRLVINTATFGGAADQLAYNAGALGNATPNIDLRELQLFSN
jgi:hypothetical protein